MHGSHYAANLSTQLVSILDYFDLRESFGNAISDNAFENSACLDLLGTELSIDTGERHVRCMCHVIDLVAQEVLFGQDLDAFEESLESLTTEEVELRYWRRKGPIDRLHNLIGISAIVATVGSCSSGFNVTSQTPFAMNDYVAKTLTSWCMTISLDGTAGTTPQSERSIYGTQLMT